MTPTEEPSSTPPTPYKGHEYFQESGTWMVRNPRGDCFIVGLDDSKASGTRTFNKAANNETACRAYIDWIVGAAA